ncbi:TRAP transporter large permease subunit [Zobellella aerophila]|uniref:TRAP C4-dicarboxylate transport system permease DctM subunit domain-containing protein n=1 Tax=Zobellella aerophila TaxID=870480 RepID=A0ABP6V773_9GAMM
MMKKAGFKPEFAAAFIMVEYIGVPYAEIMLAAIIPAVLYFSGIFIGAHFEAKKQGK